MTIEQLGSLGDLTLALGRSDELSELYFRGLASQAGFREYWRTWESTHPPAFQSYVNREIDMAGKVKE